MKRFILALPLVVCIWSGLASADQEIAAYYDDVVTCESWQYKYNTCWVGNDVEYVQILREHSKTDCRQGSTWGFRDGAIWVNNGCRADFGITRSSYATRVTCGSNSYKYKTCYQNRPIRDVRLARQLSRSSCVYGRTWGFHRDAIWVDQGCRAEFDVYFGR